MGQQVPQKENNKEPQLSIKDQVKQYTKEVNKMRRQHNRDKYKLEYQGKTLQRDLKKKIDKGQSLQSKKVVGQQILKNNQMIQKYNNLDNQLQGINFQLQEMVVHDSMNNIMQGMNKIMSGASNKIKGQNFESTMKRFMHEKERMNILGEMVEDTMNNDEGQIQDEDVDKLINDMTQQAVEKKKKKETLNMDEFQDQVHGL